MIKTIKNIVKNLKSFFKKSSIWTKLIMLVIIALVFTKIANANTPHIEAFSQKRKFVVKKNNDLYDDFYCSVYDQLLYDTKKNDFEVVEIDKLAKIDERSSVLDLGCGKGHYVNFYNKRNVDVRGIDKSKSMIKSAKKAYPNCNFKNGDFMKGMTYQPEQFSHALCLYFTIYYVNNKRQFLENVYKWLKPGGVLVLHMVNRDMFDPIIPPSDPLVIVSAQKYAKKRITNSQVKFQDFMYKANFSLIKDKDIGKFEETFTDNATNHVRKNEHTLYMEPQKTILSKAKSIGFILEGHVDMVHCRHEYQYLYFLKKPN
tara:strand:- start:136 stop:1080 length:945 start_codon:yes stop_codon:yes gene_type:complete